MCVQPARNAQPGQCAPQFRPGAVPTEVSDGHTGRAGAEPALQPLMLSSALEGWDLAEGPEEEGIHYQLLRQEGNKVNQMAQIARLAGRLSVGALCWAAGFHSCLLEKNAAGPHSGDKGSSRTPGQGHPVT